MASEYLSVSMNDIAERYECPDVVRFEIEDQELSSSTVAWRTPPRQYGAWETVAGNVADGLVARGWDVTLFASGDSVTTARFHAVVERGYEEDRSIDPKVAEYLHIPEAFEHAVEFDLIHSHYDFMALAYSRLVRTPMLTTIHGFSSPRILPVYRKYRDGYFVSISDSDRLPGLNYIATVYNGIDLSLYRFQERGGEDLIFLGRIHPDKGVHLAIEVAPLSGRHLVIAGIIQDSNYFEERVKPHLDGTATRFIGPVDVAGKNELFARAYALLHLNTIPERFGLVLAEANAAGVPVIAMDLGSRREVIGDGITGFLVDDVAGANGCLEKVPQIVRRAEMVVGRHQEPRQSKTDADVVHDRRGDFSEFGKIPQVLNTLEQNDRRDWACEACQPAGISSVREDGIPRGASA